MKMIYEVKNAVGNEIGKFSLSLTKRKGFQYEHIYGKTPTWKHIATIAAIDMFGGMNIPTLLENPKENSAYALIRDNNFDIRFVPVLIDKIKGKAYALPMTIEEDEILEHSFSITFSMSIKVMIALAMSYEKEGLTFDERKLGRLIR